MDKKMRDTLVINAFMQAYGKERPAAGLIVHTDQGSQYTGGWFRALLAKHNAVHSNSRKGNPYDNAVMEAFYRTRESLFKVQNMKPLNKLRLKSLNI